MTVPTRLNLPGLPISDKTAGGNENKELAYKTITDLFLRIKYWSQKIDATNIIEGSITSTQIDETFLNQIYQDVSILTNGLPTTADPDNVGTIHLEILDAILDSTNPPELNETQIIRQLLFDDTTAEIAYWSFRLPEDYHSGLKINLQFNTAATSGSVSFNVYVMATSDAQANPFTASYDTANNFDETVDASTNVLNFEQGELTEDDALAAGDLILLKIERAVSDSNDTATGDMALLGVSVQYWKALQTSPIYWNGDCIEVEEIPA